MQNSAYVGKRFLVVAKIKTTRGERAGDFIAGSEGTLRTNEHFYWKTVHAPESAAAKVIFRKYFREFRLS